MKTFSIVTNIPNFQGKTTFCDPVEQLLFGAASFRPENVCRPGSNLLVCRNYGEP
jgi:hypothetical protein